MATGGAAKFGSYIGDWLFSGYCLLMILIIGLTYTYVRSEIEARDIYYSTVPFLADTNEEQ